MPRYAYSCSFCGEEFLTAHTSAEILEICEKCGSVGALTKLLTSPFYNKKKKGYNKVGQLTEDFIEESRQQLEKQRKELEDKR